MIDSGQNIGTYDYSVKCFVCVDQVHLGHIYSSWLAKSYQVMTLYVKYFKTWNTSALTRLLDKQWPICIIWRRRCLGKSLRSGALSGETCGTFEELYMKEREAQEGRIWSHRSGFSLIHRDPWITALTQSPSRNTQFWSLRRLIMGSALWNG